MKIDQRRFNNNGNQPKPIQKHGKSMKHKLFNKNENQQTKKKQIQKQ